MANLRKYMSNGDVRNAIRRLGKQMAAELKDQEIWMSVEFRDYAAKMADFLLCKHKLYSLDILYNVDPGAPVAYTDGKNIVLNTGNPLAAHPKLLEGRFKVNLGILFHEVAHKLFLDFDTHNKGMETLKMGKLFGKFDVPAGSDLEDNLRELEQAVQDGYAKSLRSVYAEVLNIINDGHDEAALKKCFPGYISQCINAAGDVQVELSTPLEDWVAKGASKLSIYYSLMLQYAKFGFYKLEHHSDATDPFTQTFSRMEPVIDEALAEDDYKARWTHINTLVLMLWPSIRELMENNQNSSGGGGSQGGSQSGAQGGAAGGGGSQGGSQGAGDSSQGAGDNSQGTDDGSQDSGDAGDGNAPLTDEELELVLQSLAEAAQADNSAAAAPVGSGKAVDPTALAATQNGGPSDGSDSLGSIMDKIGKEKATAAVQSEIDAAQLEAIRNSKRPLIHKKVPVSTERHHEANREKYMRVYSEVEPYVRNLISSVQALLRETNEEALMRHKRIGPIVEATEAYRPDGAFFAKKKLPEDRPNMAMCVLLDESGSMYGSKMDTAQKTMIILEQFAAGIGVPLMVAGHYTSGSRVMLNIYTDFVSAEPEQDRYALGAISSHGCNRDGLPLRLCAEMLAKRPEEIRMMVVISDGAPNHGGYEGEEAFGDIKKTVAEFRRQGLIIYGAAIDDDREAIQELYGNGFLSITDLKSLPKTMVRLMRQSII